VKPKGRALWIAVLLEEPPPGWSHQQMLAADRELASTRAPALADLRVARSRQA
jgi:hypothetical protein